MKAVRNVNGRLGELLVRHELHRLGFACILQVNVPTRRIRTPKGVKLVSTGQAEGDWRAVGPNGLSTLIEVKHRAEPRLAWSDLEPNQCHRLDEHQQAGGLSLLGWVHDQQVYLLPWDILRAHGFGPGQGIGLEWAARNRWVQTVEARRA